MANDDSYVLARLIGLPIIIRLMHVALFVSYYLFTFCLITCALPFFLLPFSVFLLNVFCLLFPADPYATCDKAMLQPSRCLADGLHMHGVLLRLPTIITVGWTSFEGWG
jgi:hypothetical protein